MFGNRFRERLDELSHKVGELYVLVAGAEKERVQVHAIRGELMEALEHLDRLEKRLTARLAQAHARNGQRELTVLLPGRTSGGGGDGA